MKRKQTLALVATTSVLLCAGGIAGYWLGGRIRIVASDRTAAHVTWVLVAGVVSIYLALAGHEFGHVVGGWSARMKFFLWVAGPLKVYREGGRIRIGWNRSPALAGGVAGMIPEDLSHLRSRMMRMVAGGPLMSVAICCAGLLLHSVTKGGLWSLLALVNGCIAFATLFPSHVGQFYSDGARVWMLFRRAPGGERWLAAVTLYSQLMSGMRPRDLHPDLLARAGRDELTSLDDFSIVWMAHSAALDRGDHQLAGELVDRLLANIQVYPAPFRPSVYLDAAFFEADVRGNAQRARAYWELAKTDRVSSERCRLTVEAAVLIAEGRLDEANAKIRTALDLPSDTDGKSIIGTEWLLRRAQTANSALGNR